MPGVEEFEAMFGKAKGRSSGKRPSRRKGDDDGSGADSDSSSSFDWLNTKAREDVCHRCGRPGHRSSRCMANMPQRIKNKIMERAERARANRVVASATDESGSDGPVTTATAHFLRAAAAPASHRSSARPTPHRTAPPIRSRSPPARASASASDRTESSASDTDYSIDDLVGFTATSSKSKAKGRSKDDAVAREARDMLRDDVAAGELVVLNARPALQTPFGRQAQSLGNRVWPIRLNSPREPFMRRFIGRWRIVENSGVPGQGLGPSPTLSPGF
ncbi:hypothetical protein C8R46DRAFT_1283905 [Mycena filopes]|nr:hypothetical protein C8R46DRAFT_1283905 [Mycena filopes]